ncbi:MAG: hypothetical protein ABIO02_03090 [Patescibacteria group bacterium]
MRFELKLLGIAAFLFLPIFTYYLGLKAHTVQPVISNVCIPSNPKSPDSSLTPVMN